MINLRSTLSKRKPVGAGVWFPSSTPDIFIGKNGVYLRSGKTLSYDPKYREVFDLFGFTPQGSSTPVVGIASVQDLGGVALYLKIK